MKAYLAGSFDARNLLQDIAAQIEGEGANVTSTWLDEPDIAEGTNHRHWEMAVRATSDLYDIDRSDTLIRYNLIQGRGGMFVEWGYAQAKGKRMILVGPRTSVFDYLPGIEQVDTVDELLTMLRQEGSRTESTFVRRNGLPDFEMANALLENEHGY